MLEQVSAGPSCGTASKSADLDFPEVAEHQHVTRRDQFAAKDAIKDGAGGRGNRGRGRGRGRGRATAAKSKSKQKAAQEEEEEEVVEGKGSASSADGVESSSSLARRRQLDGETEVPSPAKKAKASNEAAQDEGSEVESDHVDEDVVMKRPSKKKAGAPKAKAKAKGKPKASAKGKAMATGKGQPAPKAKAQAKAKAKAKARAGARLNISEAIEVTKERLRRTRKPAVVTFENQSADDQLADPDRLRNSIEYECMKCLLSCAAADELDIKGKPTYDYEAPDLSMHDDLQLNVYWTRNAVGVKRLIDGALKQVAYFSRPSPTVGTNFILAKYWVTSSSWVQCCSIYIYSIYH